VINESVAFRPEPGLPVVLVLALDTLPVALAVVLTPAEVVTELEEPVPVAIEDETEVVLLPVTVEVPRLVDDDGGTAGERLATNIIATIATIAIATPEKTAIVRLFI
jgi:hypothetical protein